MPLFLQKLFNFALITIKICMQPADYVILVDPKGKILGTEEKIAAHKKGLLHRAFSVFLFNHEGKVLLQQRADTKYHFGGLWSNTCCSHQRLEETSEQAAHRRLYEELGFDADLCEAFTFIYRAEDEKTQLIEHELDTVLVGFYDLPINNNNINPKEVKSVTWMSIAELYQDLDLHPDLYTYWFKTALRELQQRKLLSVSGLQNFIAKKQTKGK